MRDYRHTTPVAPVLDILRGEGKPRLRPLRALAVALLALAREEMAKGGGQANVRESDTGQKGSQTQ
jgi:hypothetical protein